MLFLQPRPARQVRNRCTVLLTVGLRLFSLSGAAVLSIGISRSIWLSKIDVPRQLHVKVNLYTGHAAKVFWTIWSVILCMKSSLEFRAASVKLPPPVPVSLYPRVRPMLDTPDYVEPTAIYVKLRWQLTIIVNLSFLELIDT